MSTITFDTLQATRMLREKGFSKQQAEGLVELEKEKDTSNLATKANLEKEISGLKVWILSGFLVQTFMLAGLIFTMLQLFPKG